MKLKISIFIITLLLAATNCYSSEQANEDINQPTKSKLQQKNKPASLRDKASQGNPDAQYELGAAYTFGIEF